MLAVCQAWFKTLYIHYVICSAIHLSVDGYGKSTLDPLLFFQKKYFIEV